MPPYARSSRRIWLNLYWCVAAALLLAPAIAMQLSDEVGWGPGDFILMAALVAMLGIGLELTARSVASPLRRALLAAGLFALFLIIWAELAVGILS